MSHPTAREHERPTNCRLLIVEDSIDLSMLWQRLFGARGYETTVANDARTAIKTFSENEYDMVVSDYFLPDMNGVTLLERLREVNSDIPFVLVTGSRETSIQERVSSFDRTAFLNKPVKFAMLESAIRELAVRCEAEKPAV